MFHRVQDRYLMRAIIIIPVLIESDLPFGIKKISFEIEFLRYLYPWLQMNQIRGIHYSHVKHPP